MLIATQEAILNVKKKIIAHLPGFLFIVPVLPALLEAYKDITIIFYCAIKTVEFTPSLSIWTKKRMEILILSPYLTKYRPVGKETV